MKAQNYLAWVGRTEESVDQIYPERVNALAATLDVDMQQESLPPLWHWIFFNPVHRHSELAVDGHAKKGGFLPPIDLPRRMWAGGRFRFISPISIGDRVKRTSTIRQVIEKEGKTGSLAFVTVEHDITSENGGHWVEEHDIVYREAPDAAWTPPSSPVPDQSPADWSETITPDPVLLFRYSALTFNGHRIHYDREYCQQQEGYPGLIFHGPLTATLLMESLRKHHPDLRVSQFRFRALNPLFDHLTFTIHGKLEGQRILLWAKDFYGQRAMDAEALIESI
ncbi:acyl-CoA dehydrogenase [Hahella sp. CCB-MM4]|uniref:FAS1-like dehydratase domain-containing protein n=1 Tax=Hahella sp. (strain CCB-MM4) TaxID=1926491 RepID=UPI000B9C5564|nr:MaoC family dehydratase N-terminal domain-containing protein [Hahella sp. CCB-MM4]OZG72802.1 acyl-CoA dehydrogenase [Hahella sp. CCB-MM4]